MVSSFEYRSLPEPGADRFSNRKTNYPKTINFFLFCFMMLFSRHDSQRLREKSVIVCTFYLIKPLNNSYVSVTDITL